jgi:hypothetical protein
LDIRAGFTLFTGLLGAVFGVLLALDGFGRPPSSPTAIGQTVRFRNVLWVVGTFFALLVADFKKLHLDNLDLSTPYIVYVVSVLVSFVLSVAAMCGTIVASVGHLNKKLQPHNSLDYFILLREYLSHGKSKYDELWKKESERALAADRENIRMLDGPIETSFALCVYGGLAHARKAQPERDASESAMLGVILSAIENAIYAMRRNIFVRASYMYFVSADNGNLPHIQPHFTEGMPTNFMGYLTLKHGGGFPTRTIVLPVADNGYYILPGAPQAVRNLGYAIMNLDKIEFAPRIPKNIKKEIEDYFGDEWFANVRSVTSFAVHDGRVIHGVINIESSEKNLLGADPAAAKNAMSRLQSVVAVLSTVTA